MKTKPARPLRCVLSYFKEYFDPCGNAPCASHSAGQIASQLYETLGQIGEVSYYDSGDPPRGLTADLYVGHFWNFADFCGGNRFRRKIAFYAASDPDRMCSTLEALAAQLDVPFPAWDMPPAAFDHEETMRLADTVLHVGNPLTRQTFPKRWQRKIRLLNYSVDVQRYAQEVDVERRREFCYVATECGLRKGFLDVLQAWRNIEPGASRLHAIGGMKVPWDQILQEHNTGNVVYHGWIDSQSDDYLRLLKSCRFAHIPTYVEGQMGSLLEVIFAGCIPITTRAAGVDDRVLEHCILVEPRNIEQQVRAIRELLSWSDAEYRRRRERLLAAARRYQNWDVFRSGVLSAVETLGVGPFADFGSDLQTIDYTASKC